MIISEFVETVTFADCPGLINVTFEFATFELTFTTLFCEPEFLIVIVSDAIFFPFYFKIKSGALTRNRTLFLGLQNRYITFYALRAFVTVLYFSTDNTFGGATGN